MVQNPFETPAESFGNSASHSAEILTSRVGGLGGSDAALVIRAAENRLTKTDLRRLAVMCGQIPPADFGGNVYTRAGHLFEDYLANGLAENLAPFSKMQREKLMCADLTGGKFGTFAHADFVDARDAVYECKYTQATTPETADKYAAQLQWYYLLGASAVYLTHGWGDVDPFLPEGVDLGYIAPDPDTQALLLRGLAVLMDLVDDFKYTPAERLAFADADEWLRDALTRYETAATKANAAQEEADAIKAEIYARMQADGLQSITREAVDGVCGSLSASVTAPSVTRTFDKKALQKAHPEIDLAPFHKESPRAGSLTIKIG